MKSLTVVLLCWPMLASAQLVRTPPPEAFFDQDLGKSAQMATLQQKIKAGDKSALPAFWKALAEKGAPIVEPLADAPHAVLVTFVYRSDKARQVGLRGLSMADVPEPLTRLPGTDVWARTYRIRDDCRISYSFSVEFSPSMVTSRPELPKVSTF